MPPKKQPKLVSTSKLGRRSKANSSRGQGQQTARRRTRSSSKTAKDFPTSPIQEAAEGAGIYSTAQLKEIRRSY